MSGGHRAPQTSAVPPAASRGRRAMSPGRRQQRSARAATAKAWLVTLSAPGEGHPIVTMGSKSCRAGIRRRKFVPDRPKEQPMGESKADDVKGRVKEAAGVITGDKDLEREGKADQAGAKVKETAEK